MKLVVTIDEEGNATYDVQDAVGTQCLKATEHIRTSYGAAPNEKDEFFSETVDVLNG